MNLNEDEAKHLQSIVHDMNGQLFLIRGHCEIAKRGNDAQLEKSLKQIQDSTDQMEKLVRDIRAQLGFPKVLEQA